MTSRQLYEAVLIELNKENAPNLILEDFNYFANKAIYQYINKRYNIYDINQQTTDDIRVLKATTKLTPTKVDYYDDLGQEATYEVILPADYLHLLNCICVYEVQKTYKCYTKGNHWRCAATRLTSDAYSQVLDNFWTRPTYKRPYYYIHNVNINDTLPTNPYPYLDSEIKKIYFGINKNNVDQYYKADYPNGTGIVNNVDIISPEGDDQYSNGSSIYAVVWDSARKEFLLYATKYDEDNVGNTEGFMTFKDATSSAYYYYILKDFPQSGTPIEGYTYIDNITNIEYICKNGTLVDKSTIYNSTSPTDIATSTSEIPRYIIIDGKEKSTVDREEGFRFGNVSNVRLEIRYGTDISIFELKKVLIDYIKTPQNIRLTQEQLDKTEDISQMLEYPDYVCQEIVNELVHIVMENISEQRLQTHPLVTQSIANPAQQQTQPAAQA